MPRLDIIMFERVFEKLEEDKAAIDLEMVRAQVKFNGNATDKTGAAQVRGSQYFEFAGEREN